MTSEKTSSSGTEDASPKAPPAPDGSPGDAGSVPSPEQAAPRNATVPDRSVPERSVPDSTVPEPDSSTAAASTTAPSTTVPSTTAPSTTVPSTTVPPNVTGSAPETRDPDAAKTDTPDTDTPDTDTPDTDTPDTDAASTDAASTDAAETDAAETDAANSHPAGATATDGSAPDAVPLEKWAAFAPVPERKPGRARRVAGGLGGRVWAVVRHEWTLAAIGSLLLAGAMTWPTLRDPTHTIPQDVGDPTLQTWQLAWGGHALRTDPLHLWHANAFYPEKYTYAFTDSLLGYAPLAMIGSGQEWALLRYNVIFVLAFALAFFGAYALVRQLGARPAGALVAGAAFAYAPWRFSQAGHLHVLSTGGIVLALAMLARGHGYSLREGYRPDRAKPLWALGGWLVAGWQITLGFGIGLPFGYVLAVVCVVAVGGWLVRTVRRRRPRVPLRLFLADLGGGLLFAAITALMAYPYFRVTELHPQAKRTADYVAIFSPPFKGLFIPPADTWLWGDSYLTARQQLTWQAEMTLLPGFFLIGLAGAGLFVSVWTVRQRLLIAGGVLVTAALALGSNGPGPKGKYGYFFLYEVLPGFDAIRTSGRLVIYTILLLAVLAAGAVSAFAAHAREVPTERVPAGPALPLRLLMLLPFALVLAEGISTTPHVTVSPAPIAFRSIDGPALILPTDEITDMTVQVWSTDGFPRIVNGGSGVWPPTQQRIREIGKMFPDESSVRELRDLNIRTVVVVRSRALNGDYARAVDAPIDDLDITRVERGDAIIYTL